LIATQLNQSTSKEKFLYKLGAKKDFEDLKPTFTTTRVLIHVNIFKPFYLELDAFNFVLGVVMSMMGRTRHLHQVAFYLQKISYPDQQSITHDPSKIGAFLSFAIRAFLSFCMELSFLNQFCETSCFNTLVFISSNGFKMIIISSSK